MSDKSSVKVMNCVKDALLSTTKVDINRLFKGENNVSFKLENENININYSLTKNEISTLLRMALFHLLRFRQNGTLNNDNNYNCRTIIVSLLHISNDLEKKIDECVNCIFKNSSVLEYFLPVYKKKNIADELFIDTFLIICQTLCDLNQDFQNNTTINLYKEKFFNLLKASVEKCKTSGKTKELVRGEFFKILPFNPVEIVDLISMIMELPAEKFFSSNKTSMSTWGITISNLIDLEVEKQSIPLDIVVVKKVFSILSVLNSTIDTITWEKCLCRYVEKFPHSIGNIEKGLLTSLLSSKMRPEIVELFSLFIKRNAVDISLFLKFVKKDDSIMKMANIIFPLLESNLTHNWDRQFLIKLHDLHKREITMYLKENSQENSWIQENVAAVIYLIESTFDLQTCEEICNSILVNGDKLVNVNIEYMQIIDCCFRKMKMNKEYLQVLIHLLALTLKLSKSKTTLAKNKQKLNFLSRKLIATVENFKKDDEKFVYDELSKNHFWAQFIRFSLGQCLKLTDDEQLFDNTLLFRAVISICSIAYNDNGNEEYVTTIFGLATSHSEYVDIMLSSSNIKRYLVELLLILIRKNKTIMLPNHVPFYLSAYNASLSECDQILLLILKEYENSNVDLSKYRPFLWGSAAASHYSVKTDIDNALWNQPKTSQILDLFLPEIVNCTITKFPVQRTLKNDSLCTPEDVYDPAFYLPVLCELLSVHNPVAYHRVTHSGALALMLIAGCSDCEQIRLASFTVLSRFYSHLENPDVVRSNESLLWIRFIDALRNGIVELETSMNEVRLNGFVATFLARASIVGTQPLHPLYWPLHKFFMARSALKLNKIPEFKKLFFSTEIDYEAHRSWILEVIRDGFRVENDLQIAINSSVFNILLSFYVSSLSDKTTRKFILEIINSVAKLPKSACSLVNYYGIIPWLNAVTESLESSDIDFVPLLIDVGKNFFDSFTERNMKDKFSLLTFLQFLLNLKCVMTTKSVTVSCFVIYIDIVEKMLCFKGIYLSEKHMNELFELAENVLGTMEDCKNLLIYGSEFASREIDDLLEDKNSTARKSVRKLILRYHFSKIIFSKNVN